VLRTIHAVAITSDEREAVFWTEEESEARDVFHFATTRDYWGARRVSRFSFQTTPTAPRPMVQAQATRIALQRLYLALETWEEDRH
jgi:hypothetical protein